jgi:hypothetical protein
MENNSAKRWQKEMIRLKHFECAVVSFKMKHYYCVSILALLAAVSAAGCVTRATADAEAKAAFVAGQKAAYQSMQSSTTDVVVLGNVQKHQVSWVAGLTLAQALATANYTGAHDPTNIILRRNSVQTEVDPKQLLNGQDVPLHPGDVISVVGQ